jgi:hypothetical protein
MERQPQRGAHPGLAHGGFENGQVVVVKRGQVCASALGLGASTICATVPVRCCQSVVTWGAALR